MFPLQHLFSSTTVLYCNHTAISGFAVPLPIAKDFGRERKSVGSRNFYREHQARAVSDKLVLCAYLRIPKTRELQPKFFSFMTFPNYYFEIYPDAKIRKLKSKNQTNIREQRHYFLERGTSCTKHWEY